LVCKSSSFAYLYAKEIDRCPREDTREAACKSSYCAYYYAKDVDKDVHKDTWEAVKNSEYEEKYKEFFNKEMKEEII
jgi:hypothetical protein